MKDLDCELGCVPHDRTGGCSRSCACDCHRPTPGTIAMRESGVLEQPSEVNADVVLAKARPEDRKSVIDPMLVAPAVDLPNPFDEVEIPPLAGIAVDGCCPTCGQKLPNI